MRLPPPLLRRLKPALHTSPHAKGPLPPARIEVLSYLSRATLDIIGLAGLNFKFNALHPISKDWNRGESELSGVFARLFRAAGSHKVLGFL